MQIDFYKSGGRTIFEYKGKKVAATDESECFLAYDDIEEVEEDVFLWKRSFDFTQSDITDIKSVKMSLSANYEADFYEIPAITYNGNFWGSGKEPKGLELNGQPWVYSSWRSTLPGMTYSESAGVGITLFSDIRSNPEMSMSMHIEEGITKHELLYPHQETPFTYSKKNGYDVPLETGLDFDGRLTLSAFIIFSEVQTPGSGTKKAFDFGWRRFCHETVPRFTCDKILEYGNEFAQKHLYFETQDYSGFCMGLFWNGTNWEQKRDFLEIGWVGQTASLAVSFIYSHIENKQPELLEKGIAILDRWLKNAKLENGLLRCRYDKVLKYGADIQNRDEINDPANLYSAVKNYLEAYEMLKGLGIERGEYRKLAMDICDFALKAQNENGIFAKGWYNDGSAYETEGTVGAFMAWALLIGL